MNEATTRARVYDLPRLLALRRALRRVGDAARPRAEHVAGVEPSEARRLGLLPGSFNPLTRGHTALAEAGLVSESLDLVLFSLSTSTIDKEVIRGASLEDRLLVLQLACERDPRLGVLLVNRGLYVDQATLVRTAFPRADEIQFLVGFDKIVQILDPRYYVDRDAALERLFGLAHFLVAPRWSDGPEELMALLARPENRPFAAAVRPLELPSALRDVASSQARAAAASGATPNHALPPESQAFVEETGAYEDSPGRYRVRLEVLEALEQRGSAPSAQADFRALVDQANSERL
jgi:nicotinamide-nucleotide adenylyltransferase